MKKEEKNVEKEEKRRRKGGELKKGGKRRRFNIFRLLWNKITKKGRILASKRKHL